MRSMRPIGDVLAGRHLITHEVLEDDPDFAVKIFQVVFAEIDAVEQHLSISRIVKASDQLHDSRLALAVFSDERDPLAGMQMKVQPIQNQARTSGIAERNVAKLESAKDGARRRQRIRLRRDRRTHFEKCDQVGEEQCLICDGRDRRKNLLDVRTGLLNCAGQESQRTDTEDAA